LAVYRPGADAIGATMMMIVVMNHTGFPAG
jgi:hypothetical protein